MVVLRKAPQKGSIADARVRQGGKLNTDTFVIESGIKDDLIVPGDVSSTLPDLASTAEGCQSSGVMQLLEDNDDVIMFAVENSVLDRDDPDGSDECSRYPNYPQPVKCFQVNDS